MDVNEVVQIGWKKEGTFEVGEGHLAPAAGSGSLPVLATPWLLAFCENLAFRLLAGSLPPGFTSVGAWFEIEHLAPTPLGGRVKVQVEVVQVQGRQVTFRAQAWDDTEPVGAGQHRRVVIDQERFLRKVAAKSLLPPGGES